MLCRHLSMMYRTKDINCITNTNTMLSKHLTIVEISSVIRKTPGVCGGSACVGNTRIPVWLLIDFIQQGATDGQLMEFYPGLTVDHLDLAREYYEAHREEINRDIREQEEEEAYTSRPDNNTSQER